MTSILLVLLDKVHSLSSDQMRYFMNIALQWILKNKHENIYLTDSGLSIDDCPTVDCGYKCGVEGLTNSEIIKWISTFVSSQNPLREMMIQVMDNDEHPFSKLRNDSLQIEKYATYPHSGRQNAIQKDFNLLIVDAYLLARIFKTFKIDNPYSYNRRKTDEPAEPHNIIIYAGNAHSQRYRLFLNYLGFNLIENAGGLEKPEEFTNCVDIRDIDQPFFGKWHDKKDNPLDEEYFGTPDDLYYSFESAFTFVPPAGFIQFEQPIVPYDLFSQVSYNDLQYVQKRKPYKIPQDRRWYS